MSEWGPSNFEEFLRRVNRELKKSQRSAIGAVNRADTAQESADEAQGTATDAAAAAAAAASAAAAATDAASGAQQTANGAVTAAGTAKAAADAAKTAADNAATAAGTAQSAAAAAQTAASDANTAALNAAGLAASKGKTIVQSSQPTGANANAANLWVDTSLDGNGNPKNTPNRYGSYTVQDPNAVAVILPRASAQTETEVMRISVAQNAQTPVALTLSVSMVLNSLVKSSIARLRDGVSGAVLASYVFSDKGDNAGGNAETWTLPAGFTATPTASVLVVTIQSNNANSPDVYSLHRTITANAWRPITDQKVIDAAAAAASAATAAQGAQTTANTAVQNAAAAQTSANTAQSAATAAQQTADAAQTKANQAATAASTAQTAADNAQSTANTAVTNAGTAKTAADNAASAAAAAAGVANGKADVLIQSATPAAAMQKATTLWIDTTNNANTPKRWNGTAWVATTDKAATDAAAAAVTAKNAADAAQGTANQAVSDAAAAQTTANQAAQSASAAQTAATNAQTSANGKNTIKFRTAAPTTSAADKGNADGDLWFVIPNVQTGIATGQYVWMAATQTWVQQTLSSAIIASLDAAKITTGTLTGITITGVTITGTTVTGGTVQTSATGKRVVLSNNRVNFYGVDGTTDVNAGVIEGIPNGAAGGLMNFASGTGGTVFLQLGTQALPTAGSAQVYAPGVSWFPTIYTSAVYDAGTGARAPLGDSGWITPTITNAIADASLPPRYRLVNGIVYFDGLLTLTSSSLNATIFTLNAGFRPAVAREVWANRGSASQWVVRIQAGGNVALLGPSGGAGQLQMASITPFPVG